MSRETKTPGPDIVAAGELQGQESGRVEFEEGQDIFRPIETEGPGPKVKLCNLNPGVICREGKCTVRCNRHPWHIEFLRGHIHDENYFYARSPPINPGPPKQV
jgi:hypothetical protein